jgi:hypothetical protein
MRQACQGEKHNILNDLPHPLILINFHFGISKLSGIRMQPNVSARIGASLFETENSRMGLDG